jgi:ABC-type ATPase with predicted acetyltransferase domain
MALWRCEGCGTRYSVGAPRCPHCMGTEHQEIGAVAQIHKGRPPTYELLDALNVNPNEETAPVLDEPEPVPLIPELAEQSKPRKRTTTRAQAGHASGSGEASS